MALQICQNAPSWLTRYTAKSYDANRPLTEQRWEAVQSILQASPSSVNAQWTHFYVVDSEKAKDRIEPALHAFNRRRVRNASHWIIFTVPLHPTRRHYRAVLRKEIQDGRYPGVQEYQRGLDRSRRSFTRYHEKECQDFVQWATQQAYLAAGFFVGAIAPLGIDSTYLEGVYFDKLDQRLDLAKHNQRSVLMIAVGHASARDPNAQKPKSRLSREQLFTKVVGS